MDNLRSAIDILFLKQDPGYLLKRHNTFYKSKVQNLVSGVDKDFFIEKYISMHRPFTGDQTEQLFSLMKETWMEEGWHKASIFNVLLAFGNQVLRVKDGMPICQYEHYLRWHEMTSVVGEDILTCSFLAANDMKTRTERKSFAWNTVLNSDNTHLEVLFRRGLSELHCHLKGSSLNFDLNWLAIMNEPEYQKPEWFKKASGHRELLYKYSILAAFIRMYLFLKIKGYSVSTHFENVFKWLWDDPNSLRLLPIYINCLQSEITCQLALHAPRFQGGIIDYAIPTDTSLSDRKTNTSLLLVGERRLMYECFKRLQRGDATIPGLGIMFYIYLVIKLQVRDLIIQHNGVKGFANFKGFDRNKQIFIEHSRNKKLQELVPTIALESYSNNRHINYFEIRIAPKDTAEAITMNLNQLTAILDKNKKLNCVIHFIKDKDKDEYFSNKVENRMVCRNHLSRIQYRRQSITLEILLQRYENRIVGIDTANSEFGCRPEVFAEIYRRLQHLRRDTWYETLFDLECHDLGITYHVGEDYYDIVDGLRAIEEAILFLNMTDGARLGHAVALGIGVQEYYKDRKNTIIIPKQDLLDNCVWLLAKMDEYTIEDNKGVRNKLRIEFQRLMNEIYPHFSMEDYRSYFQSWLLRGDEPSVYMAATKDSPIPKDPIIEPYYLNHFDPQIEVARAQRYARLLYRDYHYDAAAKYRGHQPEEWKLPEGLISVIDQIQVQLRNEVARRKIAIEVNPTSNLRICNIDTYDSHPVVKFRNYGLSMIDNHNDCPQISVSINTDDKGIFATSLEKEYTLMALALEKQKTAEGTPRYRPDCILNWLEGIRQEAEIQRFGKMR